VPLSRLAIAIPEELCSQNTGSVDVFPGLNPKKPMSNGTILVVLKRMGIRTG